MVVLGCVHICAAQKIYKLDNVGIFPQYNSNITATSDVQLLFNWYIAIKEGFTVNKISIALVVAATTVLLPALGNAKGCVKGAAVGGVAGHVAGHHAVAGAAAGCVIQHHREKVKDKAATQQSTQQNNTPAAPGASPSH